MVRTHHFSFQLLIRGFSALADHVQLDSFLYKCVAYLDGLFDSLVHTAIFSVITTELVDDCFKLDITGQLLQLV